MTHTYIISRGSLDGTMLFQYQRLLLSQPQLDIEGLWVHDHSYFVVGPCFTLEWLRGPPAQATLQRFYGHFPLGLPSFEFVQKPPDGSHKIDPGPIEDLVSLRGVPRVMRDIMVDLRLLLTSNFPPFAILNDPPDIELRFECDLTTEQLGTLRCAVTNLDLPHIVRVVYSDVPPERPRYPRRPSGDLSLIPSWGLPVDAPRSVRQLAEEDEELWLANRHRAFLGDCSTKPADFLPPHWQRLGLRCVIDATVGTPQNIRLYLTLYDTVTLALPLEESSDETLGSLGISSSELLNLLGTGRVQILLPQSIDRYNLAWLASAVETYPESILTSRRLACATLVECRRRMPFLNPALELRERRQLLRAFREAADDQNLHDALRKCFKVLGTELPEMWSYGPSAIHRDGATETPRIGTGWLAARFIEEFHGENRLIEVMGPASSVEWTAALDGVVVPRQLRNYCEDEGATYVASLFSVVAPRAALHVADPRIGKVVDGLLALDNDISVVEFAREFRGADVQRLRTLINEIVTTNQDDDFLENAIASYNDAVRQYEKRPSRLQTFNLAGYVPATITAFYPELLESYGRFLPLGMCLLMTALTLAAEPTSRGHVAGRIWDYANGFLAQRSPRAVLISRLRKQLNSFHR